MKALRFRVQNFRNVDDSDWIELDRVTAFVGRNESGKSALLRALHKFNPALAEPYDPQKEFPRDRYNSGYIAGGAKGGDWPVCSVAFSISEELQKEIADLSASIETPPKEVVLTRFYDGSLTFEYSPALSEKPTPATDLKQALTKFAGSARRIQAPSDEQEAAVGKQRQELAQWATGWTDRLKKKDAFFGAEDAALVKALAAEVETKSGPLTADMVEALLVAVTPLSEALGEGPALPKVNSLVEATLPVFIYFENYGVLDSSIWLPRFLEDLAKSPAAPQVRTISAMFKHVGLDAEEIRDLGTEAAAAAKLGGKEPTAAQIAEDQRKKEERSIRLNSASIDITERFSRWYKQRRHKVVYRADGNYFRIWVSDNRRPDVEIELEARSKGFQWFFSFYLVFLVESNEGHRDAILLLDEPGVHLHATAQQELLKFFETLSEKNQLLYSTHSPFLVDGENIHRVRPVTEDETGRSRITAETWPKDRETIFPLQAAAGYAMLRGLFQHRKNVLVEGMSDYYYLHALAAQCRATNRASLPEDIYIVPCGGTKLVGHLASLFLGQEVRPLVLLDGDDAGRVRQNALLKELYAGHENAVLMLDEAIERAGHEVGIEDLLGEERVLPALKSLVPSIEISAEDRGATQSFPSQAKRAASRMSLDLPEGWKATVALHLVSTWAREGTQLPADVLDRASMLFRKITERFATIDIAAGGSSPAVR